jgi:hypothetical protein
VAVSGQGDLPELVLAGGPPRRPPRCLDGGEEEREEDRHHADDDEEFDEREGPWADGETGGDGPRRAFVPRHASSPGRGS